MEGFPFDNWSYIAQFGISKPLLWWPLKHDQVFKGCEKKPFDSIEYSVLIKIINVIYYNIPSPIYLSSTPSFFSTLSVTMLKYSVKILRRMDKLQDSEQRSESNFILSINY